MRLLFKLLLTIPIQIFLYAIADGLNTTHTSFVLGGSGAIIVMLVCMQVDKVWRNS